MRAHFKGDPTMIKKIFVPLLFALSLGTASAYEATAPATGTANPAEMANPFAWMGMMNTQPSAQGMNLARPEGYTVFMNPMNYPQFMNPATYGQFMTPQFYMQFADPNNMMAWMNPAAYAAFMNPATYMYWMNPAAYTHMMNPAMYMQAMNPAAYNAYMNPNTYMQWMNPGAYAMPATASTGAVPFNFFDPNAWAQMVPQASTEQAQQ